MSEKKSEFDADTVGAFAKKVASGAIAVETETMFPEDLTPTEKIDPKFVDKLRALITKADGWPDTFPPVIVDSQNGIINGHHRVRAALLEVVAVPVIRVIDTTDLQYEHDLDRIDYVGVLALFFPQLSEAQKLDKKGGKTKNRTTW